MAATANRAPANRAPANRWRVPAATQAAGASDSAEADAETAPSPHDPAVAISIEGRRDQLLGREGYLDHGGGGIYQLHAQRGGWPVYRNERGRFCYRLDDKPLWVLNDEHCPGTRRPLPSAL